jgi:hypothetical protein
VAAQNKLFQWLKIITLMVVAQHNDFMDRIAAFNAYTVNHHVDGIIQHRKSVNEFIVLQF